MKLEVKFTMNCDERLKRIVYLILESYILIHLNTMIDDTIIVKYNPLQNELYLDCNDKIGISEYFEKIEERIHAIKTK